MSEESLFGISKKDMKQIDANVKKANALKKVHKVCGIVYHPKWDADYCPKHNIWISQKCPDKKCSYCSKRPAKPCEEKKLLKKKAKRKIPIRVRCPFHYGHDDGYCPHCMAGC